MSPSPPPAEFPAPPAPPPWRRYLGIARLDHWIKNIFVLPGILVAGLILGSWRDLSLPTTLLALLAVGLAASANYTINEFLDAPSDRFHPVKKFRPGALGLLDGRIVFLQYLALAAAALALGEWAVNPPFTLTLGALLIMGGLYNVRPFRLKDRVFLDVLSESINNPLRLLLGWFILVDDLLPPSSVVIAYWMGGAFLMAVKRHAEYQQIGDPARAGDYRLSFRRYTLNSLLLSAFFYAISSSFFLAVFLIKYRIEYILVFPLFSALFTWYLALSVNGIPSGAEPPEDLHRQKGFMAFTIALGLLCVLLLFVDLPWLRVLLEPVRR
ncbi:MAG: UbiA family prenyltransferase [Magnetococcales bacterium]|nr:UbiA family prenyltransferase [Magnetococcales bacterium]